MKKYLISMSFMVCFLFFLITSVEAARVAPSNPITGGNSSVQIIFDGSDGLPYQYKLLDLGTNISFWGEQYGNPLQGLTRRLSDQSELTSNLIFSSINTSVSNQIDVNYQIKYSTTLAASLTIRYTITGHSVIVSLENVTEPTGYNLIDVYLNSLVTIRQNDGGTPWFTYGDDTQRLAYVASAANGSMPNGGDFFPISSMGKSNVALAYEVQQYEAGIGLNVLTDNSLQVATLGVKGRYRDRGGPSTVNPIIGSLQKNIVRIDFMTDYDGNANINWLDPAKELHDRMPAQPSKYFNDKFMYILMGEPGLQTSQLFTFMDGLTTAKRIAGLIDGNPQVASIAGWPAGGHDTAYPNSTQINPLLGGQSGYLDLSAEARDLYNTNLGFDDNYDDQYNNAYSSPYFDLNNIARNPDLTYARGGTWNGVDQAYTTSFAYYMRSGGPGEARIQQTVSNYNLQGGGLIDVLSAVPFRHDYSVAHPSSATNELINGKFKILDLFRSKGVDVYSERYYYPFLGKLSASNNSPMSNSQSWSGFGGDEIPMMNVVLRNSMLFGVNPNSGTVSQLLKYGLTREPWLNWYDTPSDQEITDIYYLNTVINTKLHDLQITNFVKTASAWDITLTNNSSIHANLDAQSTDFNAFYNGIQIMGGTGGGWVTAPLDNNRLAFYSKTAMTLTYPLPSGVLASHVIAKRISADTQVSYPVNVVSGMITVNVPAQSPIIVYLNYDSASNKATLNHTAANIQYGYSNTNVHSSWAFDPYTHYTSQNGDYFQLTFYGSGIDYIAPKDNQRGNVDIYIDGTFIQTVNAYSATPVSGQLLYSISNLPIGMHSIKVIKTSGSIASIQDLNIRLDLSGSMATNIALGKTVTASSTYTAPYSPSGIVDGNESTAIGAGSWANAAGASLPQWVQVDLGTAMTFNRIELFTSGGYGVNYAIKDYEIQYWNGSTWVDCVPAITGNTYNRLTYRFSPITSSKIRVLGNAGPDVQPIYVRVNELEVYNDSASPNIALGATATASTTYTGYSAAQINDGNTNTNLGGANSWANASGTTLPQWVQLDFGINQTFSRVELYTTTGYEIRDYEIQYWNGSAWVDCVPAITGNTNNHRTHTFRPITSSKIRVLGNSGPNSQTIYVRVNELQVY